MQINTKKMVETATKTHRNEASRRVEKLRGKFQYNGDFFRLRVENSTPTILVIVLSISKYNK